MADRIFISPFDKAELLTKTVWEWESDPDKPQNLKDGRYVAARIARLEIEPAPGIVVFMEGRPENIAATLETWASIVRAGRHAAPELPPDWVLWS